MRLLDRYMLRELVAPLGFCLAGFLVFWMTFDLLAELDKLQAHRLGGLDVLEYYAVRAPEFIVTVLPIALLLAALYALGRHTRFNELTAMRTAGLSVWRICAPHVAVAFVASMVFFVLNEFWVPDADQKAERVLNRRIAKSAPEKTQFVVRNFGFTNTRAKRTWQFSSFNLHTGEMADPKVDWERPNGSHMELIAKRALWENGVWIFRDVWQNIYVPGSNSSPTTRLLSRNYFDTLAMRVFSETPKQIRSEIKISTRLGKRAGKRADIPLVELYDYLRFHPELAGADRYWFYTKLHGRLAAPWACLVAALIAVPFSIGYGRRNVYVGVASSIGLCFCYFVLLQLGLALGVGGYAPPWLGAWLPNCSFGIAALWLISRAR